MSNPEPTDVGPIVGGDLRVSETDRQRVLTLLDAALAEGRITADERDARVQAAMSAQTFDDLIPLTRDLVPLDESPVPGPGASWSASAAPANVAAEPDLIFTIFSGTERKGTWVARRHINVLNLFGGTELDLTSAQFLDSVCEISVFCLFGGVDVIAPAGADVRNDCLALFGGAGMGKHVSPTQPGGPTIIVKGFVGFGGVSVSGPKPRP